MGNKRGNEEHREKRRIAYKIYKQALRNNSLIRAETCENCLEKGNIEGHHTDYNKPLEVVWLCQSCHDKIHLHSKFSDECKTFESRTSEKLSQKEKETLFKNLGINQFRRVPIEERCTREERTQLEEYKQLWNHFMIEHFRAEANAKLYYEKMQIFEMELKEKYPIDVEQLY
jgi:hypothetical protein